MGRRSGSGKGGMQSAGLNYSIICPKCRKSSARREDDFEKGTSRFLHFTKSGSKWHEVTIEDTEWRRTAGLLTYQDLLDRSQDER